MSLENNKLERIKTSQTHLPAHSKRCNIVAVRAAKPGGIL